MLMKADRSRIVLAAMAAGGRGAGFNPVQVQKLLFLVDREIPDGCGGPHFEFRPYHYGPFDSAVSRVLGRLAANGKVIVDTAGPYVTYTLSEQGRLEGRAVLDDLSVPASRYLRRASRWVLSQSFWGLISGIYRSYPEMAANTKVPAAAMNRAANASPPPPLSPWRRHPWLVGVAKALGAGPRSGRNVTRDATVTERDWRIVGDDLRRAIEQFSAEGT